MEVLGVGVESQTIAQKGRRPLVMKTIALLHDPMIQCLLDQLKTQFQTKLGSFRCRSFHIVKRKIYISVQRAAILIYPKGQAIYRTWKVINIDW